MISTKEKGQQTVICPGSFDPVTNGHIDIIRRAAELYDNVIVLVARNLEKSYLFTTEERVEMINVCIKDIPNVRTDTFEGLLADYVRENNVSAIVKGLRAVSDFEYEFQMALTNRKLYRSCETVFFTSDSKYMYLSSSIVRQIGSLGGDISSFVPPAVHDEIKCKLIKLREE